MAAPQPIRSWTPRVFISSTAEDLEQHRQAARDAAQRADIHADMHEYWVARDKDPYDVCMERVDGCDVLVVLVAHRYGWEPPDQPRSDGDEFKNITWLECERALTAPNSAQLLAFLLDDKAAWPEEHRERARVTRALEKHGAASPEFLAEATDAERCCRRLAAFKAWLQTRGIRAHFTDARSVREEVERALAVWKQEHAPVRATGGPVHPASAAPPEGYLEWVRTTYGTVELLGLDVKEAHVPRLSQIYVPAVTTPAHRGAASMGGGGERTSGDLLAKEARSREALLLDRLDAESLYVPGPAGSGKSTFCKWAAWLAATGGLSPHPLEPPERFRETFPESFRDRLPVYIALRSFWPILQDCGDVRHGTRAIVVDALARWAERDHPGGLDGAVLRSCLERGKALLILDGVDEVPPSHGPPDRRCYPRELLLTGLADALRPWTEAGDRVLLTSRPYGLPQAEVQRLGLATAPLEPLPDDLQRLFVARWFAAADPDRADQKREGLLADVTQRVELRGLTGNPMLLTALCVRYNQGERLPEDRFHLYDSVVNGVLYGRYLDEAKERGPVRRRLAAIALGMHTGEATGQARDTPEAEVPASEVDRILQAFAAGNRATEGTEATLDEAAAKRADLLSRSGLLLPRDQERVAFYHLSFQEFLAAEHLLAVTHADGDLLKVMRRRAKSRGWHATVVHLFSALALRHRSPQWAVEALLTLVREQTRKRVQQDAAPAVCVAECVDLALAKGWDLGTLRDVFTQLCLHAIEDDVAVLDRARLGLTLGRLGDPRSGVGVLADGTPDFEWVRIPAGRVVLEHGTTEAAVAAFEIARYPITNAQFQAFVEAEDGCDSADHGWWEGLKKAPIPKPKWSEPNVPRERVSWFDAWAFCRWLGARMSRDVRLPTEREWLQAATGGDPTREYPWGAWQEGRCNSKETGIERTSSVGLFPKGAADGAPMDMAGNVWEWCEDGSGLGSCVVRGGSWDITATHCRSASFARGLLDSRYENLGFRPARSVTQ